MCLLGICRFPQAEAFGRASLRSREPRTYSVSAFALRYDVGSHFDFGASAEARTRNDGVGGHNFIQLDYGRKNKSIISLLRGIVNNLLPIREIICNFYA